MNVMNIFPKKMTTCFILAVFLAIICDYVKSDNTLKIREQRILEKADEIFEEILQINADELRKNRSLMLKTRKESYAKMSDTLLPSKKYFQGMCERGDPDRLFALLYTMFHYLEFTINAFYCSKDPCMSSTDVAKQCENLFPALLTFIEAFNNSTANLEKILKNLRKFGKAKIISYAFDHLQLYAISTQRCLKNYKKIHNRNFEEQKGYLAKYISKSRDSVHQYIINILGIPKPLMQPTMEQTYNIWVQSSTVIEKIFKSYEVGDNAGYHPVRALIVFSKLVTCVFAGYDLNNRKQCIDYYKALMEDAALLKAQWYTSGDQNRDIFFTTTLQGSIH